MPCLRCRPYQVNTANHHPSRQLCGGMVASRRGSNTQTPLQISCLSTPLLQGLSKQLRSILRDRLSRHQSVGSLHKERDPSRPIQMRRR